MYHEIKFIFNTNVDLTLDITTKRSKLRLELDLAKIFYNVRFFFYLYRNRINPVSFLKNRVLVFSKSKYLTFLEALLRLESLFIVGFVRHRTLFIQVIIQDTVVHIKKKTFNVSDTSYAQTITIIKERN
jgi:hypothetical protein